MFLVQDEQMTRAKDVPFVVGAVFLAAPALFYILDQLGVLAAFDPLSWSIAIAAIGLALVAYGARDSLRRQILFSLGGLAAVGGQIIAIVLLAMYTG